MSSTTLLSLIFYYSSMYNVDPLLVQSVMQVESGGNQNKIGAAGEVGVLQLMPKYFPYSKKYLKETNNNIRIGIKYISFLKKECPYQYDKTYIICYNLGIQGAGRVKYPKKYIYYKKVMKEYNKIITGVQ